MNLKLRPYLCKDLTGYFAKTRHLKVKGVLALAIFQKVMLTTSMRSGSCIMARYVGGCFFLT